MGPVGQEIADNPVNRAYLTPTHSPIQEIGRNAQVRTQCLVGVFAELGLNAAPAENLSCYSHWRREQRLKGRHGKRTGDHANQRLLGERQTNLILSGLAQVLLVYLCAAYSPPAHIFSHLMRSVCSTEGAKGRKGGVFMS